jgi:hypothetical protein
MNLRVDVREYAVGWSSSVYLGGGRPAAHASMASFSLQVRGGASISRARRMSRCGFVSSVRCRNVPAGLVKVPMWMRLSSRRSSGQVSPAAFSAIRVRRRASQHRMTWARIRS